MTRIKVGIYEDRDELREGLRVLLENNDAIELLYSASNCLFIEDDIKKGIPDVVLMDIDMPGRTGIEGAKILKRLHPKINILMLTVFEDDDNIFKALEAGATGYLIKSTPPQRIVNSIIELNEGGSPISAGIARRILLTLPKTVSREKKECTLTPREEEVLKSLELGNSVKLVGSDLGISYETVRTHVKKIYEKLQVNSATGAINKARKSGWL